VNPPHLPGQQPDEPAFAGAPAAPAQANTKYASVAPAQQAAAAPQQSDGFFSSLARKVGIGGATADTTASTQPAPEPAAKPKTAAKPKALKPETRQAEAKPTRPPLKPSVTDAPATANAAPAAAPQNNVVAGGTPIMQTNSFDNRFSAAK
jgi:hypothetical protein